MPKWRTPRGTQLRHCAKVALAAVVAYALTFGGRNDYALFSAMGASLVVGGSVGEDLSTSLNRVRGTVAGALVGAALAIRARQDDLVARHCGRGNGMAVRRAGLGRLRRCESVSR